MAMKEQTFEVPAIPDSIEAFLALRDGLASTPHGGAVVYVVTLNVYAEDESLGQEALTIAVDRGELTDGPKGYKGKQLSNRWLQALRERIRGRPYVARSYIQGTSPEGKYALPAAPLQVAIREQPNDVKDETAKVFVHSFQRPWSQMTLATIPMGWSMRAATTMAMVLQKRTTTAMTPIPTFTQPPSSIVTVSTTTATA